jgi:hypothetical protein
MAHTHTHMHACTRSRRGGQKAGEEASEGEKEMFAKGPACTICIQGRIY